MCNFLSPGPLPLRGNPTRHGSLATLTAGALLALLAGCGGSSLGPGTTEIPNDVNTNAATGLLYIVDNNQTGAATDLGLLDAFWGRLVEVHQLMDDSATMPQVTDPAPLMVDFVIPEDVQTLEDAYRLEVHPVTHRTRLVILARHDSMDQAESALFDTLLLQTQDVFPLITPKSDADSEPAPFSFIARNACLVLRFDDLLDDDAEALANLVSTVMVFAGQPPNQLQDARIFFDPTHGASLGGTFHSTRVLVDATTPNVLGFPASSTTSDRPNVSIRIPTRTNFGSGQFHVLTNLAGSPLDPGTNEPSDPFALTFDVVRAMRAGNRLDLNNGFLEDGTKPDLLGSFAVMFDTVIDDPMGTAGLDYLAGITFQTACEATPQVRDIFVVNSVFLEITAQGAAPVGGQVFNVACRTSAPVPAGVGLTGPGAILTRYDPAFVTGGVTNECWVSFAPTPASLPATQVLPGTEVILRFSEPMDSASMSTFDNFLVVTGAAPMNEDPPLSTEIVVGIARAADSLAEFTFQPTLPLSHVNMVAEPYHVRLRGATDLAGNALNFDLPFTNFTLEPTAATKVTGGVSLRFPDNNDELEATGPDIRGQISFIPGENTVRPRPVQTMALDMDGSSPVPAAFWLSSQFLFPPAGQPLNRLGMRMQNVWRYCDFGFDMLDETKYDLDIVGLSWAPSVSILTGTSSLISEFYEAFEMRLAHSFYLPDEGTALFGATPPITDMGLGGNNPMGPFNANIFDDPRSPELIAHPRNLGYAIDVSRAFFSGANQLLMPYPYDPLANAGVEPPDTFTWRDTAVEGKAAPGGVGIPMSVEGDVGVLPVDPLNAPATLMVGSYAGPGQVPTVGLPLLVEIRTYPGSTALGLNLPNLAVVLGGYGAAPTVVAGYRALSSGYFDAQNIPQLVNPDAEVLPAGHNGGPVLNAPIDNLVHIGQIDAITKWSRAHTVWIDAGSQATWMLPIVAPAPAEQPLGTEVRIEFRGADSFAGTPSLTASRVATNLDAYGNFYDQTLAVNFHLGVDGWTEEIADIDGSRYVQVRFSFKNNIATGTSPTLTSLGLPYEN